MESQLQHPPHVVSALHKPSSEEQIFDLAAYCYSDRITFLPQLTSAFLHCGGWVLERNTLSASSMEFHFEVQLGDVLDLYGALIGLGIEFTRAAHSSLTDLCTCRKNSSFSTAPRQVLSIRLQISFLADVTLHALLMSGCGTA